ASCRHALRSPALQQLLGAPPADERGLVVASRAAGNVRDSVLLEVDSADLSATGAVVARAGAGEAHGGLLYGAVGAVGPRAFRAADGLGGAVWGELDEDFKAGFDAPRPSGQPSWAALERAHSSAK